jgi:hypothetical protein
MAEPSAFFTKAMHHGHFTSSLFPAKSAVWGAIDLVFRIFQAGNQFSQFSVTKSDSFPWSYPSATHLVGRLRSRIPPHAEGKRATFFQTPDEESAGSLAHRRRSRG